MANKTTTVNTSAGKDSQSKGVFGNLVHLQLDTREVIMDLDGNIGKAKEYKIEKGGENLVYINPLDTQVAQGERYKRAKVCSIAKQTLWLTMQSKVLQNVNGKPVFDISQNIDQAIDQGYRIIYHLTDGKSEKDASGKTSFTPSDNAVKLVKNYYDLDSDSKAFSKIMELMIFNPGKIQFGIRDILHLPGITLSDKKQPEFPEECIRKEAIGNQGQGQITSAILD